MGVKSSKLISTFATFLLVLDELQHSATESAFYFNPLFQISTKIQQIQLQTREQVRMNIVGGAFQHPYINVMYTKAHQNQQYWLSHCSLCFNKTTSWANQYFVLQSLACWSVCFKYILVMWRWRMYNLLCVSLVWYYYDCGKYYLIILCTGEKLSSLSICSSLPCFCYCDVLATFNITVVTSDILHSAHAVT